MNKDIFEFNYKLIQKSLNLIFNKGDLSVFISETLYIPDWCLG